MKMPMKNLISCQDCKFFVKSQEEKGVCSQERGETQPEEVPAKEYEDALDDAAPIRRPEDRHGQFLVM